MSNKITIYLASPRGFCAGVVRAIEIVEKALNKYGAPIYVKHEIVHNNYVVDDLAMKGAITLKDINEAPIGSTVIFSAHGSQHDIWDRFFSTIVPRRAASAEPPPSSALQ